MRSSPSLIPDSGMVDRDCDCAYTCSVEAFVLGNAGGRVDKDTIRTLTVLDSVAGIRTLMVVHHTGMPAPLLLAFGDVSA